MSPHRALTIAWPARSSTETERIMLPLLRALARILIGEGAPLVAIDPDVGNLRARRAFARAGFVEDAVVQAEEGLVALMVFRGDR
jgi:RimJ/RimL family protein N-acetyltransferase